MANFQETDSFFLFLFSLHQLNIIVLKQDLLSLTCVLSSERTGYNSTGCRWFLTDTSVFTVSGCDLPPAVLVPEFVRLFVRRVTNPNEALDF